MARNPLPRSNFGTASLVERRNSIPPVELEEGSDAEVLVDDDSLIETPNLSLVLEEDGSVLVDFDPSEDRPMSGDFYANLVEDVDEQV